MWGLRGEECSLVSNPPPQLSSLAVLTMWRMILHLKYATVFVAQTSNENVLALFPSTLCSGNEPGIILPHTHSLDVSLHVYIVVVIVSPLPSQLLSPSLFFTPL